MEPLSHTDALPSSAAIGEPKRSLFGVLAQQRRFVYLVTALLSLAGLWTVFSLPSAIYPELNFSRITIVAEGSSLGARQILFAISRPIEEAVGVVPGVTRVQSRSIRGGAEINVTFAQNIDIQVALQQVQARINQIRGDLPLGLELQVERLTPSLFPIVSYNLEGGDPATLYDIAQYSIRPLFSRVPGVGRVDVQGSDVREMEVVADPSRLAGLGLTYPDLASIIEKAITPIAVGRLPADYKQYLIVTTSEAHSADDIANVVVSEGIRVRDIATVRPGTEDHVRIIAGDGRPAALLNITRQVGGNTVAIADSIAVLAQGLARTLPPGVRLKPVYDQAALVRDAVASVRDAMIIGAVLAIAILLLFLRHARITAISASAIPLTMAITVFVMARLGQTFNLMTLGAMAIAIGLVIDDAVVITENIVRHLGFTPDRSQAIRDAVQELVWPVTTSTLTTVVVFLPLGLLTGVEGQFFKALSITLTIAVLVSLVLALTIIPLLSEQYLKAKDAESEQRSEPKPGVLARLGYAIDALAQRYERSLDAVLHHGGRMILVALLLVASGAAAYRFVGTGFLPEMDEGAFVLDYFTPGGTALDETDRMVHVAERILASTPEIAGTSRRTGAELGLFATQQNRGDIAVRLTSHRMRDRTSFEIIDDVRQRIATAVPRLRVEFVQILSDVINDLAGAARPVEIKLFGSDLVALEK
ncbi:MAG: efflux RND transporter permease subunit, partial [Gemmatimonadaceae bacterium]